MKDYCEIDGCESPAMKEVEVSENKYADSKRSLCYPCHEAYTIGCQHGTFRTKVDPRKIKGSWSDGYVTIDGKWLDPAISLKIRNHSPDGFAWGHSGSGPAQLALAILLEFTSRKTALALYQGFKSEVIAKFPGDKAFEMDGKAVRMWIDINI